MTGYLTSKSVTNNTSLRRQENLYTQTTLSLSYSYALLKQYDNFIYVILLFRLKGKAQISPSTFSKSKVLVKPEIKKRRKRNPRPMQGVNSL